MRTAAASPQDFSGTSRAWLLVEGEEDEDPSGRSRRSLDVEVMEALLDDCHVEAKSGGNCREVRSAVAALNRFRGAARNLAIIDRDHREGSFVDPYWANGPFSGDQPWLLIWRRASIESYLVEPSFLRHAVEDPDAAEPEIGRALLSEAQRALHVGAANVVIARITSRLRDCRIHALPESAPASFEGARDALGQHAEWDRLERDTDGLLGREAILNGYDRCVEEMTGGAVGTPLALGRGSWLHLLPGKRLLGAVINPGRFAWKAARGMAPCSDIRELRRRVCKRLVSDLRDHPDLPEDLRAVRAYFRSLRP